MVYIIACLMAALSFILNRLALKLFGRLTVITYSPVVEESAKTLLAYFLGADILLTHFLFGLIEAFQDLYISRRRGMAAAGLSVTGHTFFGIVTVAVLKYSGYIMLGLGCGILTHLSWNLLAVRRIK
jgi:hypothetical protein